MNPLLYAEVGVNFQGVPEWEFWIDLASRHDIRTLKGQYFHAEHIEDREKEEKAYLQRCILSLNDVMHLIDYGWKNHVDVFFTPECHEEMRELYEVEQKMMKISHVQAMNPVMLQMVREHLTPTFISIDPQKHSHAKMVNVYYGDILGRGFQEKVKFLYCVGTYPPKLDDLKLEQWVPYLKGYSNHYPDILAPLAAYFLGAEVIEVHVKRLMRTGLDDPVSVDWRQFIKLQESIEAVERMRHG